MDKNISNSLQENLIVLLCFDDKNGPIIRNTTKIEYFESDYQTIANRCYSYIDEYKAVPGEHIADLLEDILNGKDQRKANRYDKLLTNIFDSQDTTNSEYIMSSIFKFIRRQQLKIGVIEAAEIIKQEHGDYIDRAENVLSETLKSRLNVFEPGIIFSDLSKSLAFIDVRKPQSFNTGVAELDTRGLGPTRKELHLFVALPKRGKTSWLIGLGKQCLIHRNKVLHVTLEMSEDKVAQRYVQSVFSIPKRGHIFDQTIFVLDSLNRLSGFDSIQIKPKMSLSDTNIKKKLINKMSAWGSKFSNLIIKEFPTGGLTINQLKAYLDTLEARINFIPDLLIVDYADLMTVDTNNFRHELGNLYKNLRGVAVERNIAIATATQANRSTLLNKAQGGGGNVDESSVSEDFSKIFTVDCVISYNRTDMEKSLGLARLFVSNARNDEDRFEVLITQNYSTGQFILDSTRMVYGYKGKLSSFSSEEDN